MTIELLIENYGLIAIFLGTAFEGETAAFLGGVVSHRHLLTYWSASLTASAGSFVADQTLFFAGRYARHYSFVRKITGQPILARVTDLLERHPTGFIFAFRFLLGLRTISPIVIGTSRVPMMTFVALNAAAAIVWGQFFTALGYLFGHAIEQSLGYLPLHRHMLIALAAAVLVLIAGFVMRKRKLA
jgi:membrane protein DedA with SNARE-associated domain